MNIALIAGTANPQLARAVADELGIDLSQVTIEQFPSTEYHVEILETVRGKHVYILQSTSPPTSDHLLQLLLLSDASWRAGAVDVTALVPYFGYARHDRRANGREPVAARLVADLIREAGIQRLAAVDLHTPALEGFFGIPVEHLTAIPLLAHALDIPNPDSSVVIAPDFGAVKLAERYATLLGLPLAVVHKQRLSTDAVRVSRVVGDVRDRVPIVVDDMITTGSTVHAAFQAVLNAGCKPEIIMAATHGIFVGQALERLKDMPLRQLVVSDSAAVSNELADSLPFPLTICSLGPLLAETVRRLHQGSSLSDLLARR